MIILPKSDVAVKELFQNKKILQYFLSDVLEIRAEEIHAIQLKNTFLRRRHRWQKLGILDVVLEMNNDTKVNIELQVKFFECWDKRQIFYLAKLYGEDLRAGEGYGGLKKCIGISILDFNLSERPEYHSIYRLRDKEGNEFSDVLEVHVLELKKKVSGHTGVEEWIRFFNIETEEELNAMKTNNPGIIEAIGELRRMSLKNPVRQWYEAYMKQVRDDRAWRNYVRKQAREEGMTEGRVQGRAEGRVEGRVQGRVEGEEYKLTEQVCRKLQKGKTPKIIAEELEEDVDRVQRICSAAKSFAPGYEAEKVFKEIFKQNKT